jgi:hypothetical protein
MSETYVPTPAEQNSSCTMPEDGDALTAASVRVALEELSDAIDLLEDVVFDAEIMARFQPWHPVPLVNCAVGQYTDAWGGTATDYRFTSVVGSGAGAYAFEVDFCPAHGAELDQVRLYGTENAATVAIFKLDMQDAYDAGGDIDELPGPTLLGSGTTFTAVEGIFGYIAVTIPGTEIVDRSRYRYVAQVTGTDGSDSNSRWYGMRVTTTGNQIDKAAG